MEVGWPMRGNSVLQTGCVSLCVRMHPDPFGPDAALYAGNVPFAQLGPACGQHYLRTRVLEFCLRSRTAATLSAAPHVSGYVCGPACRQVYLWSCMPMSLCAIIRTSKSTSPRNSGYSLLSRTVGATVALNKARELHGSV